MVADQQGASDVRLISIITIAEMMPGLETSGRWATYLCTDSDYPHFSQSPKTAHRIKNRKVRRGEEI